MKKLAIIIVNYNVAFFLEQCLISVLNASKNLDCEVFVVDNKSVDNSVSLVQEKFPMVHLIANEQNVGFSKANNQAIRLCNAEFVLLLNPDTLVEEDTFDKVCAFMEQHPDAGGLGVRMIDGKGRFLPESKRGLPTPMVAFYKIFGLSKFFPQSKRFGYYHLSFLSEFDIHEVDVLSGAFMLLRKEALDRVGLLDETFFMYGEDIDLSYRLQLGGYKNYYFPKTQIIHYKGESTKKGSLNYVFVFYRAMVIFADKHFRQKGAFLFSALINMAIWLRASLAVLNRLIKSAALPLFDAVILWFVWTQSAQTYELLSSKTLAKDLTDLAFPLIAAFWPLSLIVAGAYDGPFSFGKILRTAGGVSVFILVLYSLLPEDMRFSRLLIVGGSLLTLVYFMISRYILRLFKWDIYSNEVGQKRFLLLASDNERERLLNLLNSVGSRSPEVINITPDRISELKEIVRIQEVDEVIFSGADLSVGAIIAIMSTFDDKRIDFKIAPPNSDFVIGSNSIDTQGDLYLVAHHGINTPQSKRRKRWFDISVALLLIVLWPFKALFMKKSRYISFKNTALILFGELTWVGFNSEYEAILKQSGLKKALFQVAPADVDKPLIIEINERYSRAYSVWDDFKVVFG